jgi:hypothetical protein
MTTGAQIRAARKLLGWEPFQLAQRAKLHSAIGARSRPFGRHPSPNTYPSGEGRGESKDET